MSPYEICALVFSLSAAIALLAVLDISREPEEYESWKELKERMRKEAKK